MCGTKILEPLEINKYFQYLKDLKENEVLSFF
jgi:hypothetical protein